MKDVSKLFIKILILLAIFLVGYYFGILRPRLAIPQKASQLEKEIAGHYSNLLQNRLAFVELTKLNPGSAAFSLEKSNLVEMIQKTNQAGQETLEKVSELPTIDKELAAKLPALLEETKQVYQRQNKLLEKIFATDSYQAGVAVIKSGESVKLLTDETNLVLEYEHWLDKIKRLRNASTIHYPKLRQ